MTIDKHFKKGDKPMIGTGVGLTTTVYGERIMEEIYNKNDSNPICTDYICSDYILIQSK